MRFEEALPLLRQGKIMHFDGFYRYRIHGGRLEFQSKNAPEEWDISTSTHMIMSEHWKIEEEPRVYMGVVEAVERLIQGKRLAREVFHSGSHIRLDDRGLFVTGAGSNFRMDPDDVLATDWYEVT